MIRVSEMVLPGHPDKFCDQVADAIIAECVAVDADAYGQVEVSTWSDQVWLSGAICTRRPLARRLEDIVVETGLTLGYQLGNHIDASRYQVTSTVCQIVDDPVRWSAHVNDQSVVIGWAGYDEKTRYLPPEHFLVHAFREGLIDACGNGALAGQGPDGKLLVRMRDERDRWSLEHVLVTIQQTATTGVMDIAAATIGVLRDIYSGLRAGDARWRCDWRDVALMINPNGPMVEAGSDGDNGQTGRKLVMDFYGPRIPIGGGALSGKHLTHVDRIGAYAARDAAVRAVQSGADECLVRLAYAPNRSEPLDIFYDMIGRGERQKPKFFSHPAMAARYEAAAISATLAQGRHFFEPKLAWNAGASRAKSNEVQPDRIAV